MWQYLFLPRVNVFCNNHHSKLITFEFVNFPSSAQNELKMVSRGLQSSCKFVPGNPQEPPKDSMGANAPPPRHHSGAIPEPPVAPLDLQRRTFSLQERKQCFEGFQGSLNRDGFLSASGCSWEPSGSTWCLLGLRSFPLPPYLK